MNQNFSISALLLATLLIGSAGALPLFRVNAQAPPPLSQIYVSTTGNDTTGNGSLAGPYATISHAVIVAPSGAIILVEPGTYNEMVTVMNKNLTVMSMSGQPQDTVINASGLWGGLIISGPATSGTIIRDLTIQNANNHGIYVQDNSHVIIAGNVLLNNGLNPPPDNLIQQNKAITIVGTSYCTVVGNTISNNKEGGISVDDDGPFNPGTGGFLGASNPALGNVVSGNTVTANGAECAIILAAYNQGEGVVNNIVSNNVVVDNIAGIIVAADILNTAAINNSVAFNTIMNNGEGGVVVHSNDFGDIVTNNVVIGNTISSNGPPSSSPGVIVGGEGPVPVQNTTISSNIFHDENYGINVVNGVNTTVTADNMFDSSVSIPVFGATITTSPVQLAQSTANSALSTANNAQSTLSTLNSTLSSTQSKIDDLNTTIQITTGVAYAALAIAIVLGAVAIVLARRKPASTQPKRDLQAPSNSHARGMLLILTYV